MTQLLVCTHRWTPEVEGEFWRSDADGNIPKPYRMCGRCTTLWFKGDPEPRVVFGKLLDEEVQVEEACERCVEMYKANKDRTDVLISIHPKCFPAP